MGADPLRPPPPPPPPPPRRLRPDDISTRTLIPHMRLQQRHNYNAPYLIYITCMYSASLRSTKTFDVT